MNPIAGVHLAGIASGLKASGKPDLMLATVSPGTAVAGVLTRSSCPSQPILWCRDILPRGSARALLVNSGNANAATGKEGWQVLQESVDAVAYILACDPRDVYIASTGVIGDVLEPHSIAQRVPAVHQALSQTAWTDAAQAIRTTDTFAKGSSQHAIIGDTTVTINGIAKGSGMIAPNMGTMLAFIFTDAVIAPALLQKVLNPIIRDTFNSITVDGDTSTSDTVLCFATGTASHPPATRAQLRDFRRALREVCHDLALQIVQDGEGATKLIETHVIGAKTRRHAHQIGLSIANSLLVRTALSHHVISWGRFMMAIGKTGLPVVPERIDVAIGGWPVVKNGHGLPDMATAEIENYLRSESIVLTIDLHQGTAQHRVWSCDLTEGYITINNNRRHRT